MNQSKGLLNKPKKVSRVLLLSLIRIYLTLKIQLTLISHQHLEAKTKILF